MGLPKSTGRMIIRYRLLSKRISKLIKIKWVKNLSNEHKRIACGQANIRIKVKNIVVKIKTHIQPNTHACTHTVHTKRWWIK